MRSEADQASQEPQCFAVPGAVLLAFLLVASIWAASYWSVEARLRRASARVVRLAEKAGDESPVALGLAANRLGKFLAANAVLELEEFGTLATGRQEIVQLFAQVRSALAQIRFEHPAIVALKAGPGMVDVHVAARYRLVPDAGAAAEGDGQADLHWVKGRDGWQITRAVLQADQNAALPGGWK
jgi:hypothetical protein